MSIERINEMKKELSAADFDCFDHTADEVLLIPLLLFSDVASKGVQLNMKKFQAFVEETRRLYNHRNNPFHNFNHGITVMQSTYFILKHTKAGEYFGEVESTAMLFAGLMHDIDHTGRNNIFETASMSELALNYNDYSVLENHHCSTAFKILKQEKFNICSNLSADSFKKFRKVAIEAILATDMRKHFEMIEEFRKKANGNEAFVPNADAGEKEPSHGHFYLLTHMVLHTSDLYVPTKKVENAIRWNSLVCEEFMAQNAHEKKLGLPETPTCKNLDIPLNRASNERFFVEKLVTPLWIELDKFVDEALVVQRANLRAVLKHWAEQVETLNSEEAKKLKSS